jgi:hypothetical protein
LDLIGALEDVDEEEEVIRIFGCISQKCQKSAEDREAFGSFDGVTTMILKVRAQRWQGRITRAFMLALPSLCKQSVINRGIARDEGALDHIVEYLLKVSKEVLPGDDEDLPEIDESPDLPELQEHEQPDKRECAGEELGDGENVEREDAFLTGLESKDVVLACIALEALCRANDGNKKAAARISEEFNEQELIAGGENDLGVPLFKSREGALEALIAILERTYANGGKNNTKLQVVAFRALRSLTSDDDHRQLSCAPSAVQNREFCADKENFVLMRKIIRGAMTEPSPTIAQVVLPLMKDMCWNQTKIHELVFEDNILPLVLAAMEMAGTTEEPVVKAVLIVLRQFCFSDDMKKLVAYDEKFLPWSVAAVKTYTHNRGVLEQAFGLFSNLCLKMPAIAEHLTEKCELLSLAHITMHKHPNAPTLLRTVVQTVRNISKVESVLESIKESVIIEELRDIVVKEKDNPKWRDTVEITKQFLRELREDVGLRDAPQCNEYY